MSTTEHIRRRRRSAEDGYTLIEILIVMGLIGVFVSLIIPDFNKIIPAIKVDKAAHKVVADLQIARQTAIGEMSYVRFFINPGGSDPDNGYTTEVWDRDYVSSGVPGEPVEDPLKRGADLSVDFDTLDPFIGVALTSVASEVRFTPLGTLAGGVSSDIDIILTHSATGYSRTIRVSYPIGRIQVVP